MEGRSPRRVVLEDRSMPDASNAVLFVRVVWRVRVGREIPRCGRGENQLRGERYIVRTLGGTAPARRVLVLCHSGGPGRFRDFFVPT